MLWPGARPVVGSCSTAFRSTEASIPVDEEVQERRSCSLLVDVTDLSEHGDQRMG